VQLEPHPTQTLLEEASGNGLPRQKESWLNVPSHKARQRMVAVIPRFEVA